MMNEAMFIMSYKVQVYNVDDMSKCVDTYFHTREIKYSENEKINRKVYENMKKFMILDENLSKRYHHTQIKVDLHEKPINKGGRKRKIHLTCEEIEAITSIKGSKYAISKLLYINRPRIEEIFAGTNTQEYKSSRKKPVINERYLQTLINIYNRAKKSG